MVNIYKGVVDIMRNMRKFIAYVHMYVQIPPFPNIQMRKISANTSTNTSISTSPSISTSTSINTGNKENYHG